MKFLMSTAIVFLGLQLFASDHSNFFKSSFEESDAAFISAFSEIKKIQPQSEMHEYSFEQGTIKSVFWPSQVKSDRLLILFSGTHGVEAFVGSAIQRWLMQQPYVRERQNVNILLVHGLNIYGFKNKRRVNENNIDLNRNFIVDRSAFYSDDTGYGELNSFLNPDSPASYGFLNKLNFYITALFRVLRSSIANLRTAIVRGQYSFPKGIFYGGNTTAKQWELLNQLIDKYVAGQKKVFVVDLHTGYGARGKLHLLAGKREQSSGLLELFSDANELDFADDKAFYDVQGELLGFFIKEINYKLKESTPAILGITFEYGTLDSQTTTGSIESLRRMISENQNFWYPARDSKDQELIKNDFVEMFNPSDANWRKSIIEQTDIKIKKILNWLSN